MAKAKRELLEIRECIHLHFDSDLVSGKIGDIINRLKNLPKDIKERIQPNTLNFGKLYYDFEIEVDVQYEERDNFKVYGFRKETDEEYNARIKRSADAKKAAAASAIAKKVAQEKREKTLYESLKKKFEKTKK